MPTEQFANNAQTTLAAAVPAATPGASGSITVSGTNGFPAGPQFRVRVGDELMLVTAMAPPDGQGQAVWTVTRGAEGTAAPAHAAGDSVTQVLTAGALAALTALTANQPANAVYAGPAAGGAAAPGFRALVTADLPDDLVTDAKLRNSAALSVIGRGANTTGDPADIAAAADGQVLRRSGTALGFGAVDLASPNAVAGTLPTARLDAATQADQEAGTSTAKVVTSGAQKYHPSAAKAWVTFTVTGGVLAVKASYNVSGVTRDGAGVYTVTFATPFSSGDAYAMVGVASIDTGTNILLGVIYGGLAPAPAAGSCAIAVGNFSTGAALDPKRCSVVFYGDQ